MVRLQGKILKLPDKLMTDKLQCVFISHKQKVWCYFLNNPYVFKTLVLTKVEYISLPLLDVYEIHANVKDGLVVGYVFDCYSKNINYSLNFLTVCNDEFKEHRVKHLNKNAFDFKYRISDINLYEYKGMASMLTCGLPEKIRDVMEFN